MSNRKVSRGRWVSSTRRFAVSVTALVLTSSSVVGFASQISAATVTGTSTHPSELSAVKGASWSSNVKISFPRAGEWRFSSNGLPAYGAAAYYAVPSSPGPGIPTSSTSQVVATATLRQTRSVSYTLPLVPVYSKTATATALGPIGLAVNGALFFNAYEANGSTVALASNFHVTQHGHTGALVDNCNGHFTPSPGSMYHYHGLPTCIVNHVATGTKKHSPTLLGFAFDGFGIYDNVGEGGRLVKPSTLDSCNGIFSPVPGHPQGIYHYVVLNVRTKQSSIGCYHGVVSSAYTVALSNELRGSSSLGGAVGFNAATPATRGAVTAQMLAASPSADGILIAELQRTSLLQWCR